MSEENATEVAQKFVFEGNEYTAESLKEMSQDALLALRNQIAEELGVAHIKSFKDHEQAVNTTFKALEKFSKNGSDETASTEKAPKAKKEKAPKVPKPPKEPRELPPAKCAGPALVKRPSKKMFGTIRIIKDHPGTGDRVRRWANYKDGQTLVELAEGDGTDPLDISFYVAKGYMVVDEATDEQYQERLAAWYKKHGMKDPAEDKAIRAKEREEAKAKADAERAEKKAAAAEAKAKKAEAEKAAAESAEAEKADA